MFANRSLCTFTLSTFPLLCPGRGLECREAAHLFACCAVLCCLGQDSARCRSADPCDTAASPSVRYYEGMEHGDQANVSDDHDPEEVVVGFLNFDIDALGKFLLKLFLLL